MTNDEKEDWAKELQQITSKIDELANDLTDDKYSQATNRIKKDLEACKNKLGFVIENLK